MKYSDDIFDFALTSKRVAKRKSDAPRKSHPRTVQPPPPPPPPVEPPSETLETSATENSTEEEGNTNLSCAFLPEITILICML